MSRLPELAADPPLALVPNEAVNRLKEKTSTEFGIVRPLLASGTGLTPILHTATNLEGFLGHRTRGKAEGEALVLQEGRSVR